MGRCLAQISMVQGPLSGLPMVYGLTQIYCQSPQSVVMGLWTAIIPACNLGNRIPHFGISRNFLFFVDELEHRSGKNITILDLVHFSLQNYIPVGISSNVVPISVQAQLWSGIESLTGVVFAALFATHIFRWSFHR